MLTQSHKFKVGRHFTLRQKQTLSLNVVVNVAIVFHAFKRYGNVKVNVKIDCEPAFRHVGLRLNVAAHYESMPNAVSPYADICDTISHA